MKQTNLTPKTIKARNQAAKVKEYILNAVDCSGYTVKEVGPNGLQDSPVICNDDKAKVNFVLSTFESEYLHKNNQNKNRVDLFAEWLQGLPSSFNIDFENYRIVEIAKEWESLPQAPTEAQEDKILANWWNFIANKFFQLHRKLN